MLGLVPLHPWAPASSSAGTRVPCVRRGEGVLAPGPHLAVVSLLLRQCLQGQGAQAKVVLQEECINVLQGHMALQKGWRGGQSEETNWEECSWGCVGGVLEGWTGPGYLLVDGGFAGFGDLQDTFDELQLWGSAGVSQCGEGEVGAPGPRSGLGRRCVRAHVGRAQGLGPHHGWLSSPSRPAAPWHSDSRSWHSPGQRPPRPWSGSVSGPAPPLEYIGGAQTMPFPQLFPESPQTKVPSLPSYGRLGIEPGLAACKASSFPTVLSIAPSFLPPSFVLFSFPSWSTWTSSVFCGEPLAHPLDAPLPERGAGSAGEGSLHWLHSLV